ncbi:hypothetical protein E8E13_001873 [Curvularia kusanoi]|uniref:Thymocyte nuclear protein 1 n=1 Tax=Curvularia kusanoi TaxID=90978 RepID=A0A9P4T3T5_CURKU|nr:hypothetical protein E8E13_001873 [Curvularia kusanoi]
MASNYKTIAIIGITGCQGSSVARTFLNQPGWKLRGVTRRPTSAAAVQWQIKGVEMVYGDLELPGSMRRALKGATVVFGVTDFWQHIRDPEVQQQAADWAGSTSEIAFRREIQQGWTLVDAVAATVPTVERFIFSTLSSARTASEGAISSNLHFDSKAEITAYLKREYPALWTKTSLLTLGCYADNWKRYTHGTGRPEKVKDGVYKVCLPMDEHRVVPFVEPNADTGMFVKALLDLPAGENLVGAGSLMSWGDWCSIWGQVNNVECTFERQDRQAVEQAAGLVGREIADMYRFFEQYGYCGVDQKDVIYPWDLPGRIQYTTMEDYIQSQDWTSVLNPGAAAAIPKYNDDSSSSSEKVKSTRKTTKSTRQKRAREEDADEDVEEKSLPPAKRSAKSNPETKPAETKLKTAPKSAPPPATASNDSNRDADGKQEVFWLLKAEPLPRYENGVNVAFSIDDLANCTEPEPWGGVRNPQARNNMQAMRKGDLGFFYHSNAKPSGVVGILRVVEEAKVDETAFDKKDPYYDPKSDRAKPKWFCVGVEFVKKFDEVVDLKSIKDNAAAGGKLKDMQLITNGRLSVCRVRKEEWDHIMDMAEGNEKADAAMDGIS